ncbi:MAG: HipA family kinase [Chitinophagaceae bacterium]
MNKITEVGYVLPVIEALSLHEVFNSGANRPLLITGVDSGGVKEDYVVKLRSAERMSNEACMRELLALFIAAEMDIKSVSPVVINISPQFVDLLVGDNEWQVTSQSIGLNFGSKYIKGPKTILVGENLNSHQLPYAQAIFAFDILIQNADRTVNKPNMLTDGAEIIILDHELAFGFVFDLFKNPTPWQIREKDKEWINKHCLLTSVKGRDFDYQVFCDRLDRLDENFWQRAWNLLPVGWQCDQFRQIKEYFTAICANKTTFILELKKVML